MDRPPPDPTKLLEAWMEWEHGETPPGRVISNLKTGGMRELLESLSVAAVAAAAEGEGAGAEPEGPGSAPSTEAWTPVV